MSHLPFTTTTTTGTFTPALNTSMSSTSEGTSTNNNVMTALATDTSTIGTISTLGISSVAEAYLAAARRRRNYANVSTSLASIGNNDATNTSATGTSAAGNVSTPGNSSVTHSSVVSMDAYLAAARRRRNYANVNTSLASIGNNDATTTSAAGTSAAGNVSTLGNSSVAHSSVVSMDAYLAARRRRNYANAITSLASIGNNDATTSSAAGNVLGTYSAAFSALEAHLNAHRRTAQNRSAADMLRSMYLPLAKRQKLDRRQLHLPLPTIAKNSISTSIPLPPNWQEHMHQVSQSLAPYKLFPVNSLTNEFKKLAELLHPLHINGIDQIVNPGVWNRFVNGREEMLKAKCSDSMLLRQLGLTDADISKRKQSLNFFRHKSLDAAPYNDNFVLLFHCTRQPENIEFIQRDGFDERMSRGGMLGKGIYFSDNFMRSIRYDGSGGVLFMCGVLLGDCVLNPKMETTMLMKEPEKLPAEQRFIDDYYFDSLNGITTTDMAHVTDQYTVYNRYQCYPLYKVNYVAKSPTYGTVIRPVIRPPFVWPVENVPYPNAGNTPWVLNAKTIFDAMNGCGQIPPIWLSIPFTQKSIDEKLGLLKSIDEKPAVDALLQRRTQKALKLDNNAASANKSKSESEGSSYHSSTDDDDEGSSYHTSTDEDNPKPSTSQAHRSRKKPVPSTDKDCSICYNTYPKKSNSWRTLPQCDHKLCVDCYKKIEITRTTMAGIAHTFVKCPFCLLSSGVEIGICPNGQMTVRLIPTRCDGYGDCETIMVTYTVSTPMESTQNPDMPSHSSAGVYKVTRRIAYLPNNREGQKVLHLLRIAWDRRIIFTIGTSHTTGRENALVWNIHHKTCQKGGVACHGYPDATYLDRVSDELKSYGIK